MRLRGLIISLLALAACWPAAGEERCTIPESSKMIPATADNAPQDRVEELLSQLDSCYVSFDYSYSSEENIPIKGKGHITVQGKSYRMEGDGLKIWCDAVTRWTLDPAAKEAYIENVSDSPDLLSNPVPYLRSLSDLKQTGNGFTGLYSEKGRRIRFTVSNIKAEKAKTDLSEFAFDLSSLTKAWVVTDLR